MIFQTVPLLQFSYDHIYFCEYLQCFTTSEKWQGMNIWTGAKLHGAVHQHGRELTVDNDHGRKGQCLNAAHYEAEEQPANLPVGGESKKFQECNRLCGLQTLRHGRLLLWFALAARGGHLISLHGDV